MTPEEISALFDRWLEAYARRDSVALANIYGDSCVVESPSFGTLIGRTSIEKSFQDWSTITASRALPAAQLLENIIEAVHAFAFEVEQSDDVTALVIRYTGR